MKCDYEMVRNGRCHELIFSIIALMMFTQYCARVNEFKFSLVRESNLVKLELG